MREMSGPSEPVRLREESASALERALLDAGRSYRSTGTARAKTLAALGVAGSATLLAGTAQAVPLATLGKITLKMTWGKLIAAISIVGAAAAVPVGYFAWQRHHQPAKRWGRRRPPSRRDRASFAGAFLPPSPAARSRNVRPNRRRNSRWKTAAAGAARRDRR